jgi:pimeloyl-ACP methyl ester carboxylesterase
VEDLHYLDTPGRLPALLCIHGFCQSSTYWAPTLERLARLGVRGLAPDLAGFGASAAAPGPYTMEAYADRLAIWLDTLGVGRIVLVGGSMGGVVAQYFALRHPQRVERLLLVATGSYTIDPAGAIARAEAMARRPWTLEAVRPMVNGFFHRAPPGDAFERYLRIALAASPEAVVEAARSNALSRTLESLETIAVPTLIVQGRHDRVRTPEHGAEMRHRIHGARLVILNDSGHTPHLEMPEAFHAAALPFLLGKA